MISTADFLRAWRIKVFLNIQKLLLLAVGIAYSEYDKADSITQKIRSMSNFPSFKINIKLFEFPFIVTPYYF